MITQVSVSGGYWSCRDGHAVVAVGNTLLLMGGSDTSSRFKDVWTSTSFVGNDVGKSWTFVGNAPWTARCGHGVVVIQSTVILFGGTSEFGKISV